MKHKPIEFLGVLGVITTATLMGAGEASAIVALDTFDVDQTFSSIDSSGDSGTVDDSSFPGSILGSERELSYSANQDSLPSSIFVGN